jgi:RND family efflux transporter MFP subunit
MPVDRNTSPTSSPGSAPPSSAAIRAAENRVRFSGGAIIFLVLVAIALAVLIVVGIRSRAAHERALVQSTNAAAVPSVAVIHPSGSGLSSEIVLPGNTQAFTDTPIYARTSGYLKQWFFDIGARVQKGQLMATIETPELDQQLQAAQAALKSAQADLDLANTTSVRYQDLLKTNSVSKQETDQAVSGAAAKLAAYDEAQANVRRLRELQSFESVYAPFTGVVTARNTDIGALIDAGSASGAPKELFHLAAISRLRVYVAVPESYSPAIHDGNKATLTLDEYPGQQFTGTIARNSSAIDQTSRTLNVEVDVDNAAGKLLPGAYVFVHFKVPPHAAAVSIPSNTLLFRSEGLRVALVRNDRIHLQPITIGHDNGRSVEVTTGLDPADLVVTDPFDSIAEGQLVHLAGAQATANETGDGE